MRTRSWALLAVTVASLAACGGQTAPDDPTVAPTPSADADTTTTTATPPVGAAQQVARSDRPLPVSPSPGAAPTDELPATTVFGSPRALLVLRHQGDWLQVALPTRPNGSTGWVPADQVQLREVDEAIEIDLSSRTLTLIDDGAVVLTTPVAIGSKDNPTPVGAFYVVDKLTTGNPDGAYGLFAFGISAYTNLTEFAGGDGQVGIHGTNDPGSIGQAVSHGCIRVPDEVAQVLNDRIHLGTPVTIG